MLHTTETSETNYFFLSYKPEGKPAKFDYSKIEVSGKSICRYQPKNYLKDQNELFNPFVSFKTMLQFILLDKKGRIKFLDETELFQVVIYLNSVDYTIGNFGPYFYLTINKKPDTHE